MLCANLRAHSDKQPRLKRRQSALLRAIGTEVPVAGVVVRSDIEPAREDCPLLDDLEAAVITLPHDLCSQNCHVLTDSFLCPQAAVS
jgi:hypothetical protein